MKKQIALFVVTMVMLFAAKTSFASQVNGSVTELPRGTIFSLTRKLNVPANTRFVLLGRYGLQDFFTQAGKVLNDQNGRYYCNDYYFRDYFLYLTENAFEAYLQCLERHRTAYEIDKYNTGSSVIMNKGKENTNIIINYNPVFIDDEPEYYTYITPNSCMKPEYTYTALTINTDKAEQGGIFKKGYEFKVRKVTFKQHYYTSEINIYFDHEIAESLMIITSSDPKTIRISQLLAAGYTKTGFWATLGQGLSNMNSIAGNNFNITLPEKKCFD